MKIEGWRARLLVAIAYRVLKIWSSTLRYELEDRGNFVTRPLTQRCIASLWHNRLLLICIALKKFVPHRPGAGLISASHDGDLIADLTQHLGFAVVPSARRPVTARKRLSLAGAGKAVGFTREENIGGGVPRPKCGNDPKRA